jgi:hypothetical protein
MTFSRDSLGLVSALRSEMWKSQLQVFIPHHGGYIEKIEQRADAGQATCEQPEQTRAEATQVEPVKSKNPESRDKPEKIGDGVFVQVDLLISR